MSDFRQIVWLASYPKSGNTWVRCFLDAYFLNELDLNEIVTSFSDDVATVHDIGYDTDVIKCPIDIQQLTRPMACVRMVQLHNQFRKHLPMFVKTHQPHLVSNGVELLPECLTKAVVYLVRDPRDVLPSFAKHMGLDLDAALEQMQDKYRALAGNEKRLMELISSWDMHVQSYANADTHNVLVIKYEDLLADPEAEFSRILRHAGVEPDAVKVKRAVELTRLENLKKKEAASGFKESSPHAKNQFFGGGGSASRGQLEPKHLHRIEKAFGRLMKRFGYLDKRKAA